MARSFKSLPGESEAEWMKRLKIRACSGCGCPMKPAGVKKRPGEWDHARGCPKERR